MIRIERRRVVAKATRCLKTMIKQEKGSSKAQATLSSLNLLNVINVTKILDGGERAVCGKMT